MLYNLIQLPLLEYDYNWRVIVSVHNELHNLTGRQYAS